MFGMPGTIPDAVHERSSPLAVSAVKRLTHHVPVVVRAAIPRRQWYKIALLSLFYGIVMSVLKVLGGCSTGNGHAQYLLPGHFTRSMFPFCYHDVFSAFPFHLLHCI